ncbi:MAG: HNH endonuclease [Solirubrobacterales bacterium]
MRARVLARSPRCFYCGGPATTVDHVKAVSRGGTDAEANLRSACASCNAKKGSA